MQSATGAQVCLPCLVRCLLSFWHFWHFWHPSTPLGQVTPLGIGLFLDRGYSYFRKVTPCLAFLTVEGEGEGEEEG
jgi:hypothetical protein